MLKVQASIAHACGAHLDVCLVLLLLIEQFSPQDCGVWCIVALRVPNVVPFQLHATFAVDSSALYAWRLMCIWQFCTAVQHWYAALAS